RRGPIAFHQARFGRTASAVSVASVIADLLVALGRHGRDGHDRVPRVIAFDHEPEHRRGPIAFHQARFGRTASAVSVASVIADLLVALG
ncbi:hypothetical protein CTI14_65275, partial [Methylobacterium radiotolerans]